MERPTHDVTDLNHLGRRVRGARAAAGFASVEELAAEMERLTGFSASERRIYGLERGLHEPDLSFVLALVATLKPDGGLMGLLLPTTRADLRSAIAGIKEDGEA